MASKTSDIERAKEAAKLLASATALRSQQSQKDAREAYLKTAKASQQAANQATESAKKALTDAQASKVNSLLVQQHQDQVLAQQRLADNAQKLFLNS